MAKIEQRTCTHCGIIYTPKRIRQPNSKNFFCSRVCHMANLKKDQHHVICACGCGRSKNVSETKFFQNTHHFYTKACFDLFNDRKRAERATIQPLPPVYSHVHKTKELGMMAYSSQMADYLGVSPYTLRNLVNREDSNFPKPEFSVTYRKYKVGYWKIEAIDEFKKTYKPVDFRLARKKKESEPDHGTSTSSLLVRFFGGNPSALKKYGKPVFNADDKNPEAIEPIDTSLSRAWRRKHNEVRVDNYFTGVWL